MMLMVQVEGKIGVPRAAQSEEQRGLERKVGKGPWTQAVADRSSPHKGIWKEESIGVGGGPKAGRGVIQMCV